MSDDVGGQAHRVFQNLQAVLDAAGLTTADVVKTTVFLADMSEWPAMNEVYRSYFTNPPARSALGASGLALNARVEIECIAVIG